MADKCAVQPADRTDCGWTGIGKARCLQRSCCHDGTYHDAYWCFYPTDHKCYGINRTKRTGCGYTGISRENCENKGCCFDDLPNVPSCFQPKCCVEPAERTDCGWPGIDPKVCLSRGCCHDDETWGDSPYCFYPNGHKCHGIKPQNRENCGYPGISREQCENKDCCFDDTNDVCGIHWCFKETS